MNFLRTAWEALNEDCPGNLLIACWCVFAFVFLVELTMPVAFGFLMESKGLTEFNFLINVSSFLFGIFDKLGILLGLYCVVSTYTKVRGWKSASTNTD